MFTLVLDTVAKKLKLKEIKGTISYGTLKKDDEAYELILDEKVPLSVSSADGKNTF